ILWHLSSIPLSMVTGIGIGALTGIVLYKLFDRYNPRATKRALAVLGVSIIFVKIEHLLEGVVPFASLICVMAIGFIILERREKMAHELSAKFSRIWVFAEIILFTMVGTQVNIRVALVTGLAGLAVISIGLIARSIGSYLSLVGSELNAKERFFVVISYIPKATVQAAIGAAPLAAMKAAGMDIKAGEIILAVAVLSILFTAPLGAWAIRIVGSNCLEVSAEQLPDSLKAAIESDEHGEEII
ncbi:MAG: sodium:proton antiporter, partial [Candidatus Dadabacteria bacterium]